MAETTREQAKERRRPSAAEPFEEMDEAAEDHARGGSDAIAGLKRTALTAAAGAVAAGLAGAVKALVERRGHTRRTDDDADSSEGVTAAAEGDAEEAEEPAQAEQDTADVASSGDDDEAAVAETPVAETTASEETGADTSGEPSEADDDRQPEAGVDHEEPEGAGDERSERPRASGDAGEVVRRAQDELERIVGEKPERVIGFAHSDGHWSVTLEVVDMRRVPDSTDVLAIYELVFDDERNLVSLAQQRRYRRSQVEDLG
jgi:Gas vesicle synthesis protein GvpO